MSSMLYAMECSKCALFHVGFQLVVISDQIYGLLILLQFRKPDTLRKMPMTFYSTNSRNTQLNISWLFIVFLKASPTHVGWYHENFHLRPAQLSKRVDAFKCHLFKPPSNADLPLSTVVMTAVLHHWCSVEVANEAHPPMLL